LKKKNKCKQYREIKDHTQIQINAFNALHTIMEVKEMRRTSLSNVSNLPLSFFYLHFTFLVCNN